VGVGVGVGVGLGEGEGEGVTGGKSGSTKTLPGIPLRYPMLAYAGSIMVSMSIPRVVVPVPLATQLRIKISISVPGPVTAATLGFTKNFRNPDTPLP
jgi:hypothetical protein